MQEVVSRVVTEAVQTALTDELTNRQLQEQLRQGAQHAPPRHETSEKHSIAKRLRQAMIEDARRSKQRVKKLL